MRKPCAILMLISMLFAVPIARADDHLVSREAVRARMAEANTERASNLAKVDGVLSSPSAKRAAAKAGVDLDHVRQSLPRLSDSDLRDLSRRAAALGSDPAAGHHDDDDAEEALVFVIVIAAAALLLIAVANRA